MSYSKTGFACNECLESYAIEYFPATAPKRWILKDGGQDHKVEFYNASMTAVIPCGEVCEHCGKLEPVRGEGMNLTWSTWTELDI